MQGLVEHLIKPIVANPDDVSLNVIEGEATILLELMVHDDDKAILQDEDDRTLRAIRNVLSAAAGNRKASLELVDEFSEPEEASDDDSDESDDDSDESAEATDDEEEN